MPDLPLIHDLWISSGTPDGQTALDINTTQPPRYSPGLLQKFDIKKALERYKLLLFINLMCI